MKWSKLGSALLLVAAVTLGAFAVLRFQQAPPAGITIGLDLDQLDLPRAYDKVNPASSMREPTPLVWTLKSAAEPLSSTCGDERVWIWTNESRDSSLGDPTVRLYVCTSAGIEEAASQFTSIRLEDTVVPQNDNYVARTVSTEELGLSADESRMACVWGSPDRCRAWAFLARYGGHLVTTTFIVAGHGGGISKAAFERLVESVDAEVELGS